MENKTNIYFALPVLNEFELLPKLIESIKNQLAPNCSLTVCVNQYEDWWSEPGRREQCFNNQESIKYLENISGINIHLIDKSSRGKAWPTNKGGVGWARKVAMDFISEMAGPDDFILSIDADTYYPPEFAAAVSEKLTETKNLAGLAIPYYHPLTGNPVNDRLVLRYEIYMRYFLLNMLQIENPYAFTAIGSAMATTVAAYRKVGGLTPVKSGEDFYFIQKLKKNVNIGIWCETTAFPSSRLSDRVVFGTGPALIKGNTGDWTSYPLYKIESFEKVSDTFALFPELYKKDFATPMDGFLKNQFKADNIWAALRANYKDAKNFVRACENKVDALRILQFLRSEQLKGQQKSDEEVLLEFLQKHEMNSYFKLKKEKNFTFDTVPFDILDEVRNELYGFETVLRKKTDVLSF